MLQLYTSLFARNTKHNINKVIKKFQAKEAGTYHLELFEMMSYIHIPLAKISRRVLL
jgi:hypothetical protein